tara:strand:+ start:86 stop:631 length:546 start_codon:yes stop_codon:yes gene_type:complete
MTKKNRRRKKINLNNFFHFNNLFYNILIILISLLIIGFVYSFLSNINQNDKIKYPSSVNLKKLLIISEYEKKTGHRIKVEILNGCGVSGLADKFSNLLRENGFDVILSKNAPNFNYQQTQIILRDGKREFAIEVATLMGIPIEDIIENKNKLLDCDVTIIIGKDYNQLTSFIKAIELSPPY